MTSLVPVAADEACALVGTGYADIVFTLPHADDAPTPDRPRLGVALGAGDAKDGANGKDGASGGPRINQVVKDSVAESAGLKAGDVVARAAGLEMRTPDDLVEVVGRQAPGTWLPLSIRRDGQEIDVIAKFPPRPRQDQ